MKLLHKWFPAQEGAVPYVYLANLAFPLFFMMQEPLPRLVPGLILLALLAAIYRQLYWDAKRAAWYVAGELLITLALAFLYHPMYIYVVFIYLFPLARLPLRAIYAFSGGFGAGGALILYASGAFSNLQLLMILLPPLFGGIVLPLVIRASMRYKDLSEQLKLAMGEIERMAQEEERQRIARELHDTLGQTLSLISLKSELVRKLVRRNPEQAAQEAAEIQATSRNALKQMRSVVSGMNVLKLADEAEHARTLCAAAGVTFRWEASAAAAAALTTLQETLLAMSLRESITNVVRHGQAGLCTVSLRQTPEGVVLSVRDDGVGMQPDTLARKSGSGVIGIRERLSLIEGRLRVDSAPGRGTTVTMSVPLVIRDGGRKGDAS